MAFWKRVDLIMRNEAEVTKRLRQITWKYFKLRLSRHMAVRVENCRYALPRKLASSPEQTVVYCKYAWKEGQPLTELCQFRNCANECPIFALAKDQEAIKQEFVQDLKRPLFKRHEMKDLVQMEWVLGLEEEQAGEYESKFLEEFIEFLKLRHQGVWDDYIKSREVFAVFVASKHADSWPNFLTAQTDGTWEEYLKWSRKWYVVCWRQVINFFGFSRR